MGMIPRVCRGHLLLHSRGLGVVGLLSLGDMAMVPWSLPLTFQVAQEDNRAEKQAKGSPCLHTCWRVLGLLLHLLTGARRLRA